MTATTLEWIAVAVLAVLFVALVRLHARVARIRDSIDDLLEQLGQPRRR